MDKKRSLPPLIRGKARGILGFFIDEIVIFKELFIIPECDVIAKVQWWGEVVPALVRPPTIQLGKKLHKYDAVNTYYYHSISYEIRTTNELLKLYLSTCEVLEVPIFETVKSYVIGSAFLKDILKFINSSNEIITTPIVNYEGEKIGELKIHIKITPINEIILKKVPTQTPKEIDCSEITFNSIKNYQILDYNCSLMNEKSVSQQKNVDLMTQVKPEILRYNSSKLYFTSTNPITIDVDKEINLKKTLLHKSFSENNFIKNEHFHLSPVLKYDQRINSKTLDKNILSSSTHYSTYKNLPEIKNGDNFTESNESCIIDKPTQYLNSTEGCESIKDKHEIKKPSSCLPEVKLHNDSSTVLHFKISSKQTKLKSNKSYQTESTVSNIKKSETKSKTLKKLHTGGINKTCNDNKKRFSNQSTKKSKFKPSNPEVPCLNTESSSEDEKISKRGDSAKIKNDEMVFDYLLGSDMSRNDKDNALKEIKKMSPTHPVVSVISELTENTFASKAHNKTQEEPLFVKVNNLNFNLKNPVEKSYYEKFFCKSQSFSNDFEIVELLNKPLKGNYEESKSSISDKTSKTDKIIIKENISHNMAGENFLMPTNLKTRNVCAKCNYYKKIDELNVIIESLKHFERKMLSKKRDEQISEFKNKFTNEKYRQMSDR